MVLIWYQQFKITKIAKNFFFFKISYFKFNIIRHREGFTNFFSDDETIVLDADSDFFIRMYCFSFPRTFHIVVKITVYYGKNNFFIMNITVCLSWKQYFFFLNERMKHNMMLIEK